MHPITINHIAVVVSDVEEALHFWRDALGILPDHVEHNAGEQVDIAFLPAGDGAIELLAPFTEESGVAKFLAKRGAGLHHLCLDVSDLDGVLARLDAHGVELITPEPRQRPDGTRYAFIHPKSTGGVLLELYERPAAD